MIKKLRVLLVLLLVVATGLSFGSDLKIGEVIGQVLFTDIKTEFNGKAIESFNINGSTAIYVKSLEDLGLDIQWNPETRIVSIENKNMGSNNSGDNTPIKNEIIIDEISFSNGVVENDQLNALKGNINYIIYEFMGEKMMLDYVFENGKMKIESYLEPDTKKLNLITKNGELYTINIGKIIEPNLANINNSVHNDMEKYIIIPPMPKEGFYWPIRLNFPTLFNNASEEKYVFLNGPNGFSFDSKKSYISQFVSKSKYNFHTGSIAHELNMPSMSLLVNRTGMDYNYYYNGSRHHGSVYEHAFDRDIALFDQLIEGNLYKDLGNNQLINQYKNNGWETKSFFNYDEQVVNAIKYVQNLLRKEGFQVNQKVMANGFSADGTFVDRFAALHPEMVKAYFAGAAGDDFVLPVSNLKNHEMIFPLGIKDNKMITGNEFSMEKFNSVARVIHNGELDTNNVFPFNDCYGEEEREIAYALWPKDPYGRTMAMYEDFSKTGGHGLLINDKGQKHGESDDMRKYQFEFFRANLKSDTPVYPSLDGYNNLDYQLYN